jgi:tRNA (adenine22-N1)-methyltransferase
MGMERHMELSPRLKLIYNMIPPCGTLCDIGTDHALIPAYALLNGRCGRAIACDARKGPLQRAKKTMDAYGLHGRMELRLGNGLEPLSADDAEVVVIAGMGGILITELIANQLEKAKCAKRIVLQPMYAQEAVRPFLWKNGFRIEDEALCREGRKIYQALAVSFGGEFTEGAGDPVFEVVGELLVKKRDPLLPDWLCDRIRRQRKIVDGLRRAREPGRSLEREAELLDRLEDLKRRL